MDRTYHANKQLLSIALDKFCLYKVFLGKFRLKQCSSTSLKIDLSSPADAQRFELDLDYLLLIVMSVDASAKMGLSAFPNPALRV